MVSVILNVNRMQMCLTLLPKLFDKHSKIFNSVFHLNIFHLLSIFYKPQMNITISTEDVTHGVSFPCSCVQGHTGLNQNWGL